MLFWLCLQSLRSTWPQKKNLKYSSVFRDDLLAGLTPAREMDHVIKILDSARPPHWAFFQLSPSDLGPTKDYITDLLNKGK